MKHELPPLPFAPNALEPHMSRETLEYHHGKHHKAYVEKLNKLLAEPANAEFKDATLEEIVQRATGPLFNNAAQAWNHSFFWNCLAAARSTPSTELSSLIATSFGSEEEFKMRFTQTAVDHFGSGWVWLVRKKDGKLDLMQGHDAMTPIKEGLHPLLACDVWEHAYYIDHRNERPKYLSAFFSIVNWEFASRQLKADTTFS